MIHYYSVDIWPNNLLKYGMLLIIILILIIEILQGKKQDGLFASVGFSLTDNSRSGSCWAYSNADKAYASRAPG